MANLKPYILRPASLLQVLTDWDDRVANRLFVSNLPKVGRKTLQPFAPFPKNSCCTIIFGIK